MGRAGADAPACGYGAESVINLIDQLPSWVSALTSVAALFISGFALRRSRPKIWPTVWLTMDSRGAEGARVGAHINNDTDTTIKLNSIGSASQGVTISGLVKAPYSQGFVLSGNAFERHLSVGVTIPPKSSKSVVFAVKVDTGEDAKTDVRMSLSISAMRLANRNTVMLIPIDIPENSTATNPNS